MAHVNAGARQIPIPDRLELRYQIMSAQTSSGFVQETAGSIQTNYSAGASQPNLEAILDVTDVDLNVTDFSGFVVSSGGINFLAVDFSSGSPKRLYHIAGAVYYNALDASGNPALVEGQHVTLHYVPRDAMDIMHSVLLDEMGERNQWVNMNYKGKPLGILDAEICEDIVGSAGWDKNSAKSATVNVDKIKKNKGGFKVRGTLNFDGFTNKFSRVVVDRDHLKLDVVAAQAHNLDGFYAQQPAQPVAGSSQASSAASSSSSGKWRRRYLYAGGALAAILAGFCTVNGGKFGFDPTHEELREYRRALTAERQGDLAAARRYATNANSRMVGPRRIWYRVFDTPADDLLERVDNAAARQRAQVAQAPTKLPADLFVEVGRRRARRDGRHVFRYTPEPAPLPAPSKIGEAFNLWDADNHGNVYEDADESRVTDSGAHTKTRSPRVYVLARDTRVVAGPSGPTTGRVATAPRGTTKRGTAPRSGITSRTGSGTARPSGAGAGTVVDEGNGYTLILESPFRDDNPLLMGRGAEYVMARRQEYERNNSVNLIGRSFQFRYRVEENGSVADYGLAEPSDDVVRGFGQSLADSLRRRRVSLPAAADGWRMARIRFGRAPGGSGR